MTSFTESLDAEGIQFFNDTCKLPFDRQAVAFLNAYWQEAGSQADFIFEVAFEMFKYADMHAKGISYIHLYDIGFEVDFNIGLYFYEKLCKFLEDNPSWSDEKWAISQPEMMTAIKRKTELKKVDVNFDGKITMLEYLLYQYSDFCSPADFVTRSMKAPDEHPEVKKARLALEEVTRRIKAYEAEKKRLQDLSQGTGVKALGAKNQLAQIESGPLKEQLNVALIKAEAAVRKANRLFGSGSSAGAASGEEAAKPSEGAIWWLQKDLDTKQKRYGARKKA